MIVSEIKLYLPNGEVIREAKSRTTSIEFYSHDSIPIIKIIKITETQIYSGIPFIAKKTIP